MTTTPLPEPTAEDRARGRFFTATTGQPPTDEQRAAVKAINEAVVALAVVIEETAPHTLEAPSGESLGNTISKLSGLIDDIQAQLDAWTATRWTNEQILEQIAAAIAAAFAGNVAITGSLTVNGGLAAASLSTGGSLTAGGAVTLPEVFTTDVAALGGSRAAVWVSGSGRLGTA